MYRILFCFALLYSCRVFGETMGNVEFHLPTEPTKWAKVGNELKSGQTTTVLFEPEFAQRPNTEYFGVDLLEFPFGFPDEDALKDTVSKQFPGKDVQVKILTRDDLGELYEWSVSEKGKQLLHAWNRSIQTGTSSSVLLMYMFKPQNNNEVEEKKTIWLPVLRNAKKTG